MDMGAIFSSSFAILKKRPLQFVTILLLPMALMVAIILIFALAMIPIAQGGRDAAVGGVVLGVLVFFVAMVVVTLFEYRALAMMSVATYDIAAGRESSTGNLMARTKGVMGRVFVLLIAVYAAALLVGLIFAGIVGGAVGLASGRGDGSGAGGVAGLVILLYLAVIVVSVYLGVRWMFLLPILGLEGRSGFASLGRSWQMTKGNFWRLFLTSFVESIAIGVVLVLLYLVSVAILLGASGGGENMGAAGIVVGVILAIVWLAVMLLVTPFDQVFRTVMYLDQLGRDQLAGRGPQPGAPAQMPGVDPAQQLGYGAGGATAYQGGQYGYPQYGQQPVEQSRHPEQDAQQAPQYGQAPEYGAQPYGQYGQNPDAPQAGPAGPAPDPDPEKKDGPAS